MPEQKNKKLEKQDVPVVNDPIKKVMLDHKNVRFEHEDGRFIEGRCKIGFGARKFVQNMGRPKKMRYKGDNDIVVDMPEYNDSTDQDIYLLHTMLTKWSNDDNINKDTVMNDDDHCELFDRFLEFVKEENNLNPKNSKGEKKKDTSD